MTRPLPRRSQVYLDCHKYFGAPWGALLLGTADLVLQAPAPAQSELYSALLPLRCPALLLLLCCTYTIVSCRGAVQHGDATAAAQVKPLFHERRMLGGACTNAYLAAELCLDGLDVFLPKLTASIQKVGCACRCADVLLPSGASQCVPGR